MNPPTFTGFNSLLSTTPVPSPGFRQLQKMPVPHSLARGGYGVCFNAGKHQQPSLHLLSSWRTVPPTYCTFWVDLHLLALLRKKQHVLPVRMTAARGARGGQWFPGGALPGHRDPILILPNQGRVTPVPEKPWG